MLGDKVKELELVDYELTDVSKEQVEVDTQLNDKKSTLSQQEKQLAVSAPELLEKSGIGHWLH